MNEMYHAVINGTATDGQYICFTVLALAIACLAWELLLDMIRGLSLAIRGKKNE